MTELNPGIRRTVEWLWSLGYLTTDSGDGVTNVAAGMECALDYPHVIVQPLPGYSLIDAAWMLRQDIEKLGIKVAPQGNGPVWIQATYDPSDGSAVIILAGVDDAMLEAAR